VVELGARLGFDAGSLHRVQLVGMGEEPLGGCDRADVADDQDVVGIARRPVNRLSGAAAGALQGVTLSRASRQGSTSATP
jgi:hypothetical protein